jgi:hypothetical protein
VSADAGWDTPPPPELAPCIGLVGRVQTVELTQERRDALRRSLGGELTDAATSLADFCPDPLVLALDSGLPRVRLLGRVVDGGSEWEQVADVTPGSMIAVSRISEIAQRTSSAGRRMIRTTYETEFRSVRGALTGIARGFSIDMDAA